MARRINWSRLNSRDRKLATQDGGHINTKLIAAKASAGVALQACVDAVRRIPMRRIPMNCVGSYSASRVSRLIRSLNEAVFAQAPTKCAQPVRNGIE